MGGFGSGRQSGHLAVESGLTLDINQLLRQKNMGAGRHTLGGLVWHNITTGEKIASIGFEACLLDLDEAWARLHYSVNGTPQDYRVLLSTTRCHYGGRRWWWVCPRSGRRVAKLYLPPGATIFAARHVYRLAYRSQRDTTLDRSHDGQRRLYRELGVEYEHFEQAPPRRPKGMHPEIGSALIVCAFQLGELRLR